MIMRRTLRLRALIPVLSCAAIALTLSAAARSAPATRAGLPPPPHVVTSWPFTEPYGSFAEGMAFGRDGKLYASVTTWTDLTNVGQVVRISPSTGARTAFGGTLESGGFLTGLAFDEHGRLYVAAATFPQSADDPLPGIFRVDPSGPPTRVVTLPADSFPNGLVFRDGELFVSDSNLGAIWRVTPTGSNQTLDTPWAEDATLLPGTGPDAKGIGVNGIAFRGNALYVAVSDAGRLVRIPIARDGSAGKVGIVLERDELVSADGIAFGVMGELWIVTNGPTTGRLLLLLPGGQLVTVADQPDWLDYPTMPVFGSTRTIFGSLYVENGSLDNGVPSIVSYGIR